MLTFMLHVIYEYDTGKFKEVRVGLKEEDGSIFPRLTVYNSEEQTSKLLAEGFCAGYAMAMNEIYYVDWSYWDEIIDVTLVAKSSSKSLTPTD
jgi:hypothetical protein